MANYEDEGLGKEETEGMGKEEQPVQRESEEGGTVAPSLMAGYDHGWLAEEGEDEEYLSDNRISSSILLESDREDLVEMVNRIAVDDDTSEPPAGVQGPSEGELKYKESELPPHHCNKIIR